MTHLGSGTGTRRLKGKKSGKSNSRSKKGKESGSSKKAKLVKANRDATNLLIQRGKDDYDDYDFDTILPPKRSGPSKMFNVKIQIKK